MKTIFNTLFVILVTMSLFAQDTEIQPYEVVKILNEVEVRYYPSATLVETNGDNNFGKLFQYISGNNEGSEKIAMTAPVYMSEDKSEMAFVMPLEVHEKGAPTPKGKNVNLRITEPRHVAAIRYGGYTNASKEAAHKKQLLETLEANGIEPLGDVEFLGYDSPYKFYNRRNEVIVKVSYKQ